MLTRSLVLTVLVLAACKSEDAAPAKKAAPKETAAPAPAPAPAAEAPPAPEPPPEPALPTDPKELDLMRKTAILDGKFDLALKVCVAEDVAKLGEQDVLSCVLSACRQGDGDKAATWGKLLKGPLKVEARKVCQASNVPI